MGRGPWPVTRRNASLLRDTCRALHVNRFSASQEEEKRGFDVGRLSASRAGAMSRCHSGASVAAFIIRSCQLFSGRRPRGISWQEKAPSCLPKAQHPPPRGRGGPGGFPGYRARSGGLSGGDPVRGGPPRGRELGAAPARDWGAGRGGALGRVCAGIQHCPAPADEARKGPHSGKGGESGLVDIAAVGIHWAVSRRGWGGVRSRGASGMWGARGRWGPARARGEVQQRTALPVNTRPAS